MVRHRGRGRGGFGGPPMGMYGPPMGFGMRFRPPMGFGPSPMGYGPMMGGPRHIGSMAGDTDMMSKPMPMMGGRNLVTHQAFDVTLAEEYFQQASPKVDDEPLATALTKRSEELTPSEEEQKAVQNLVGKVETVVKALILTEEKSTEAGLTMPVEEVKIVGSHKKGTMLSGHPVADLVVILKDTPAASDIETLSVKVQEKLKESDPADDFPTQANEGGFNTTSNEGALVRVLVTTLPKNLLSVEEGKVDAKLLEGALATIRHARWFDENASHTTVRCLVRILKDMKRRYPGLVGLTPWLIDLLAFRSSTLPGNIREPLPINVAFRRALQLLSSGIFLPGSLGIIDPCESGQVRAHSVLSLEEQDQLSLTAQTLLRALSHGAMNEILGENTEVAVDSEESCWGGVIVTPGEPAYDKEQHQKESLVLQGNETSEEVDIKMET